MPEQQTTDLRQYFQPHNLPESPTMEQNEYHTLGFTDNQRGGLKFLQNKIGMDDTGSVDQWRSKFANDFQASQTRESLGKMTGLRSSSHTSDITEPAARATKPQLSNN